MLIGPVLTYFLVLLSFIEGPVWVRGVSFADDVLTGGEGVVPVRVLKVEYEFVRGFTSKAVVASEDDLGVGGGLFEHWEEGGYFGGCDAWKSGFLETDCDFV